VTASVALCETCSSIVFAFSLAFGGFLFRYQSSFLAFIAVMSIGYLFLLWMDRNHNLTDITDWIYTHNRIVVI